MASPFLPAGATTGYSGGELSSGDDSVDVESLQSPETEASKSLTELFEKAAAHFRGLVQGASREQLLYLYARYKQVKVGNCNTPKPSFLDFEGKQKWEAWKALGDSSPSRAMQEYIAVVKKLDPSWNPQGRALLHWACDRGHKELVTVLLQHRADINCQDNEGQTALHYAAACEFLDIVELLLQSGADPTLRDQDGCLPEEATGCRAVTLMLQQHTTGKA
ncbi:acyl-CoA-binding domain-containing protein 6 isoform X2 [Balaenoptera ricei]|uniref:acyl-CoA-binding domain-containing protein 6 isoform X2 n=1 Tax=Balaenoptera ricei TaxID=2746895 RepID=UPI0028BE5816|nr:acyl-CoA-binding domain-containing protein 6 isoform X2 [Balaenoptera ricei]